MIKNWIFYELFTKILLDAIKIYLVHLNFPGLICNSLLHVIQKENSLQSCSVFEMTFLFRWCHQALLSLSYRFTFFSFGPHWRQLYERKKQNKKTISSSVFHSRKKVIHVWNNMKVSRYFWVQFSLLMDRYFNLYVYTSII